MSRRDPKRDPEKGDVVTNEGWTYSVTASGPETRSIERRGVTKHHTGNIVRYTVEIPFDDEPYTKTQVKSLGAWRAMWGTLRPWVSP